MSTPLPEAGRDKPVAIIVPMQWEFDPYHQFLRNIHRLDGTGPWEVYGATAGERPVVVVICDVGPVNAGAACERMIQQFDPPVILHGGSAGAHNPQLMPGDVVLGSSYVIHVSREQRAARRARGLSETLIRYRRDGARVFHDAVPADAAVHALARRVAESELAALGTWDAPGWPPTLPLRTGLLTSGVIATADAWTVEPNELKALHEDYGAECEDMESAYVAQVCALHHRPFLAVRVISDNEAACQIEPKDVGVIIAAAGNRAARIISALAAQL